MRLSIYIEDDYAQLNGYKISKDIAFEIKDLERQLAEAREENKKLNTIIEMLCPKAHTPVKE